MQENKYAIYGEWCENDIVEATSVVKLCDYYTQHGCAKTTSITQGRILLNVIRIASNLYNFLGTSVYNTTGTLFSSSNPGNYSLNAFYRDCTLRNWQFFGLRVNDERRIYICPAQKPQVKRSLIQGIWQHYISQARTGFHETAMMTR